MQETETRGGWLSREQLRDARERLPILYVNLVPVRVDERSQVTQIGLLLRASDDGQIQRELVSGRVLYHERLRDAVLRHVERDLGPMALPQVPIAPQPFAVAEYFPTPGVTPFHDPRQHAVALGYVVVLMGDCQPQGNALDLAWLSPSEARDLAATPEMAGDMGSCCDRPWRTWATQSEPRTTMTSQPPPAAAAAELAARIRSTTFPRIRYHKGYDRYDVDWLLRKVANELERGTARPELADELADAEFSSTTVRSGYDEKAVDEFVDEVVTSLRELLGTPTTGPAKRSPLALVRRLLNRP